MFVLVLILVVLEIMLVLVLIFLMVFRLEVIGLEEFLVLVNGLLLVGVIGFVCFVLLVVFLNLLDW